MFISLAGGAIRGIIPQLAGVKTLFPSFAFKYVCLGVPSLPLLLGEKTTTGGFALTTLKKLNGARFNRPCASMVLAKQIGRGLTLPNRN